MRKFDVELGAGVFVLVGLASLGYLSVRLGEVGFSARDRYQVSALFTDVGGLKPNAPVVIAGVTVGRVCSIRLEDYEAAVTLEIDREVAIQEDAIASIKTRGLVGEKYVEITPGAADEVIPPGGRIRDTQPAVDFEELLSKYVFGKL